MPLPGHASEGAVRFLGRYVRKRFFSHFVVLASMLVAHHDHRVSLATRDGHGDVLAVTVQQHVGRA